MQMPDQMDDLDPEQLAVLWTKAQPVVAAYIRSAVRDAHDAEDVLHEVALVLVRKRAEYDRHQPFARWAVGIAKRQVLKYYERFQSKHALLENERLERFTEICQEQVQDTTDTSIALDYCLKQVRGRGRQALMLRYADDLKPAEVAKELGTSARSMANLLYRVRATLRECVRRQLQKIER